MTTGFEQVISMIQNIINRSKIPEDPLHSRDTLEILQMLEPNASIALKIAALGHDIERALPDSIRAKRQCFPNYDLFKMAHSENSARVLRGLLIRHNIALSVAEEVQKIVSAHEFGGFKEADLLKDADSLSFFRVNLSFYKQREHPDEVRRRIRWGLSRLSHYAFKRLFEFTDDPLVLEEAKNFERMKKIDFSHNST